MSSKMDVHADRTRLVLAMVVAGMLVASPAEAYLRDVETRIPPNRTANSIDLKLDSIRCSTGKQALGGDAFISPQAPEVALSQAAITDLGGVSFVAGARETDPTSSAWRVGARVHCAHNSLVPPPDGGAARYVKAVQIVSAIGASKSNASKSATANCPGGRSPLAGGAAVSFPSSNLAFTESVASGAGWRASAREVDSNPGNWAVRAFAVCANTSTETQTSNYTGLVTLFLETTTLPQSASSVSRTTSCPPGMSVVGGGARAVTADGFMAPADVALTSSRPVGFGATSTGWSAVAQETDATSSLWTLRVQAVCTSLNAGPPG